MATKQRKAIVLVSGGLDSTTTLAIACDNGFACHALSFDYGQRHHIELEAAKRVAASMNVVEHRTIRIDLRDLGGSALTDDSIEVPKQHVELSAIGDRPSAGPLPTDCRNPTIDDSIPVTYVPARNTIFLSYALAYAEVVGARDIFIGVNAIDYSGYPDCRPQFIEAFVTMANLATKMGVEASDKTQRVQVHTPLIDLTKAQIIQRGTALGVNYGLTVSCYDPDEEGRPCGACDSCRLRAAGFAEAGLNDPAVS